MSASASTDPLRRRPLRRALRNWRQRHVHPFNFWIHLAGIPIAVLGMFLLLASTAYRSFGQPPADEFLASSAALGWGAALFVIGYALQFWGHRVEGNDVGEWAAIKKLLGLPYVGIAPSQSNDPNLHSGGSA